MPVSLQTCTQINDHDAFRYHLYDGATFIIRQAEAFTRLNQLLHARIHSEFMDSDPEYAHYSHDRDKLVARADNLKNHVRQSREIYDAFVEFLTQQGVNPDRTALDCVTLRVQLPQYIDTGQTLSPHRDTWGSNVMSQINWWAPVYPVSRDKTLLIYPGYWQKAVTNSSEGWDYKAFKNMSYEDKKQESNLLPIAGETLPLDEGLAIVPDLCDMYVFSGAQLHASVPNTTDTIRYSLEARTFDVEDECQGHGAPNIDGAPARTAYSWFHRLSDRAKAKDLITSS